MDEAEDSDIEAGQQRNDDDQEEFDPNHPNYVFYRTIINYIRSTKEITTLYSH